MTPKQRLSDRPESDRSSSTPQQVTPSGFTGLGIAPGLLDAIAKLKFTEPTPIQRQAIPVGIAGKDIIGLAQTGTGKTLAFGIPMLQRLAQLKGHGLIITPTRELALQADEMLAAIGHASGLRTAVLIGGASMGLQRRALERKPRIIIATPGRLIDHMEHRTVNLARVDILVLDEADRMLDMGFAPQINKILAAVPKQRQMMLFSATMPEAILTLAKREMVLPLHVEVAPSGTAADRVEQEIFFVDKGAKTQLLEVMLERYRGPVLVFSRTKHGARKLVRQVRAMGHTGSDIHSNRSLVQRREALDGFKSGKYRVLVATDIAARGIDVSGIELVINYDLPSNSEDYVHRIGRTGRAGMSGRAVSFATLAQRKDIMGIERLMRVHLPVSPLPALPPQRKQPPSEPEPSRRPSPGKRPSRPPHSRPQSRTQSRPPSRPKPRPQARSQETPKEPTSPAPRTFKKRKTKRL